MLIISINFVNAFDFTDKTLFNFETNELNNLDDVNIANPIEAQVLLYNDSSSIWYNAYLNDSAHHVNASDFWITNIGSLGNVNSTQLSNNEGYLNIIESWVDSLWCRLTGCNITGDLRVDGEVGIGTAPDSDIKLKIVPDATTKKVISVATTTNTEKDFILIGSALLWKPITTGGSFIGFDLGGQASTENLAGGDTVRSIISSRLRLGLVNPSSLGITIDEFIGIAFSPMMIGQATDAIGYYYAPADMGAEINNSYGIKLENIITGSNSTYAIHTGTGEVYFGDNLTINGNMSVEGDWNYYFGQPIDGGLGSGMIWAEEILSSGLINISCIADSLNCSYPAFIARIHLNNNTNIYCNLSATNFTAVDDQDSVYLLTEACIPTPISMTIIQNAEQSSSSLGLFRVFAHDGSVEIPIGLETMAAETASLRFSNLLIHNLEILIGVGITTETYPTYSQTSGRYVFSNSPVTATEQNSSTDGVEFIYHSGGNWTESNLTGANFTHCDNGTDLVPCSGSPVTLRRYLFFFTGFQNGIDSTELHFLAAEDGTTFANLANCLDIEADPLSLTLPEFYEFSGVRTFVYCGKRDATDWTGEFLDIREGGGGFGATQDLSNLVRRDGTTPMTGDWAFGGYNLTDVENLDVDGDVSFEFGDIVSEQNPDSIDAIRLKGTTGDVDVVLGDIFGAGYFSIWNAADDTAVFFVDNIGNTEITGYLDMNSNKIFNVLDPTANQDAATKKYVDDNTFWQKVASIISPKALSDIQFLATRIGDEFRWDESASQLFIRGREGPQLSLSRTAFGETGSQWLFDAVATTRGLHLTNPNVAEFWGFRLDRVQFGFPVTNFVEMSLHSKDQFGNDTFTGLIRNGFFVRGVESEASMAFMNEDFGQQGDIHLDEATGNLCMTASNEIDLLKNTNVNGNLDVIGNVGIGTTSSDSAFQIRAGMSGTVGSHSAGQIIIQNPADNNKSNVVITGYESDGNGDPDQQLWYLGSSSASNEDITFLNRRDAKLTLGTNGSYYLTILGNGNVIIGGTTSDNKFKVYGDTNITEDLIVGGNLTIGKNLIVGGCIQYNCSDSCITLGSCL